SGQDSPLAPRNLWPPLSQSIAIEVGLSRLDAYRRVDRRARHAEDGTRVLSRGFVARETPASRPRSHGPALGSRARPHRVPRRAGAAGRVPSSAGRSSTPGLPRPRTAAVHCQESWLAFAPCPSCPASLAAVIVVQTVSKETGSELHGPYGKVMVVAFGAGILAHIFLGVGYGLLKIGVITGTGLLAYSVVLSFAPILLAALGSRFIKAVLLRPIPAQ